MIIRFLTKDDVAEHEKVASQAFVFPTDIRASDLVLPCEKVLGAFADDGKTLMAELELYEKSCHYDGGLLTCAAIGGVAAKPEHRGKGAVKALFDSVFSDGRYDISILYPFSEPYYRKLGYERVGNSVSATVPFAALVNIERNQDAVLYEGADPARLLAIYNRCAKAYNLCFVRDTAEMFPDQPYLSQSYTYIWKNNSFATFSVDRGKSTVFVKELYFDSCEAMLGVVGFLRNYETNQQKICFQNIPETSPLLRYVADLHGCEIVVHNTGSARMINPERVLKAHSYPARDGSFTLQIGGDVYHVTYAADGADVEKNNAYAPDAVMSLSRASQLLLCGFTDETYIPDLVIKNPGSDFFQVFPPKTTFFSDEF